MAISLVMVPLTLTCLDNNTFGVWTTLSSLLTLIAFFDIGLGNGLRNKLTEALSVNDTLLAQSYISTAYVLFGSIQIILIALFVVINSVIPWPKILNTSLDQVLLRKLSLILFVGVSLKLVLDLLTFTLYAKQATAKAGLILLLTNLGALVGLLVLTRSNKSSLLWLSVITASSPIIVLSIASIIFYSNSLLTLKPKLTLFKKEYVSRLLGLGSRFFLIQLAVIIIFYSDNLIIAHLFGPSEVTTYNISYRYFNIINTLFAILIAPYWSAFTEAHIQGEYIWMQRSYKRLWLLWVGVVILVFIWFLAAPTAYALWIGNRVHIPWQLNLFMGLSIIITCLNNVTIVVINGLSKIKLQLLLATFSAIINIPLCIFLGKYLDMGSAGVILATSISLSCGSLTSLIQAQRLLNQTATGIWNR